MKIVISALFVLITIPGFCQESKISLAPKKSFTVDVETGALKGVYSGCGILVYTICVEGLMKSSLDKAVFGEKVLLYITCPETFCVSKYNGRYKLMVEHYTPDSHDGLLMLSSTLGS